MPQPRPTVLIVDRDPGFLFWLGEIFTQAGYHAIPALDCGRAVSLTRKLSVQLVLVVVNPELPEVAWMLETLRHTEEHFKVVHIANDDDDIDTGSTVLADAMLPRPRPRELILREAWIDRVRKILRDLRETDTGT